eukprot:15346765-Ditylum_brightwellii.AAC.1
MGEKGKEKELPAPEALAPIRAEKDTHIQPEKNNNTNVESISSTNTFSNLASKGLSDTAIVAGKAESVEASDVADVTGFSPSDGSATPTHTAMAAAGLCPSCPPRPPRPPCQSTISAASPDPPPAASGHQAPSLLSPSSLQSLFESGSKEIGEKEQSSLCRGKWTADEAYANRLILDFKKGDFSFKDDNELNDFISRQIEMLPKFLHQKDFSSHSNKSKSNSRSTTEETQQKKTKIRE